MIMGCTPLALIATADPLQDTVPVSSKQGVSDDELIAIRQHLQHERAFGSKRFQAMSEKTLGRPASARRPGRPVRSAIKPDSI